MTLTRDRLDYTQHCFQTLRDNAGCEFDWYVLDQASTDGTAGWLTEQDDLHGGILSHNVGLCPGLNMLLDLLQPENYDVVVRFDNDCEVTQPGTLKAVCDVAHAFEAIVAPHVALLKHPPAVVGVAEADDWRISETNILGGIFMAIPARLFTAYGFRYDERNPPYTGDEAIVPWWKSLGGVAGYLDGWSVNHYERVDEQERRYPRYQARKLAEIGL